MSTFIHIDDLHKGNDKPLFLIEKQGFVISDPGVPTGRETRDQWLKRTVGCRPTRHKFMVQRTFTAFSTWFTRACTPKCVSARRRGAPFAVRADSSYK